MYDYDEFYYSTVCHVCKIKSKSLKTCQPCKLYRYCSVEHQKIHWPRHKPVCKIANELNENRRDLERSTDRTKMELKIALEKNLGRPLVRSENQVRTSPFIRQIVIFTKCLTISIRFRRCGCFLEYVPSVRKKVYL